MSVLIPPQSLIDSSMYTLRVTLGRLAHGIEIKYLLVSKCSRSCTGTGQRVDLA